MRKRKKQALVVTVIFIIILFGGIAGLTAWRKYQLQKYPAPEFGVTFSTKYATSLGLAWKDVYAALLDDFQVRLFRIPVYWDEIEQQQGNIDLTSIQFMMDEAARHHARVILAIGRRVPRWPECHPPAWTTNLREKQIQQFEQAMMMRVVDTFKDHPALDRWQVFNEAFFSVFGECPLPDYEFIQNSVRLVHKNDPRHEIMMTDSGELSTWFQPARLADVLGVSMYRVTWNSFWGYFYYPLPPSYYRTKADLVQPLVNDVIVSELQAEPWTPSTILTTSLEQQYHSMNPKRFQRNIEYVRQTGFSEVLLWGVEWWYWLKTIHGDAQMWKMGRDLFYNNAAL